MSVDSLAKIFSHSVCGIFVLFWVSFAVQKLLSLIRSHSFIIVFIVNTLRGGSEKMLLSFLSESVWPMFSSKSFIVSGLIFRSSAPFLLGCLIFLIFIYMSYLLILEIKLLSVALIENIFLPLCRFSFHFVGFLHCAKA